MSKYRTLLTTVGAMLFLLFSSPEPGTIGVGAVIVAAGELIRLWSSGYIDKNDRITREGPYSLSRNPLYIGNFIIGLGVVTASGDFRLLPVFLVLFGVLYSFTVKYEEKFLEMHFSEEWLDYRESVPRYVGFRGTNGYVPGKWRWDLVLKHREPRNIPVLILVLLLLWGKYMI